MNNIELLDKLESSENISKMFNSQWKNVQNDILFLKDDILKDFHQIETKLNNKYEKQNTSTLTKLDKFEKTIEAMNQKIINLSSLISTDKNIQQKVLQLYEFKTKIEDDYLNQEISIKNMSKELRDAINNYDKIIHDSVIYPGLIGYNGKFTTFHDLIDYLLKNISQFASFRDKNILDFKSYKTKIESLIKSFKMQANSIISNTAEYTNKKNEDLEQKIKELLNSQESKIFDLRLENNKLSLALENKIDKLNDERKKMLNIKEEIYKKFDEEVFLLKDFNKILVSKFENYQNEFKLIKNRFTTLSEFIKDVRFRINMGELQKKDLKSMSEKIDFTRKQRLSNASSQFIRNGVLAKSIIKRYIAGELGLNDVTHPLKTHKSIVAVDYDFRKNLLNNYKSNNKVSSSLNKLSKRMTLSPDKLISLKKFHKSFTNLNINVDDNNTIYSNKSDDNCISEEKDEDIDYINDYKKKIEKKDDDKITKENGKEKTKDEDNQNAKLDINLYEDIKKDKNETVKTDNIKKEDGNNNNNVKKKGTIISLLDNNKKNNSIKIDDKNNDIIPNIDKEDNLRTKPNEKPNINNNSFPKIINNTKEKSSYLKNQKLFSINRKLNKIDDNNNNNFSLIYRHKYNRTNLESNNYDINNSYNYGSIKNNNFGGKLNIVEMNFDENNSIARENALIKKVLKDLKEDKINLVLKKNNDKLDEKNLLFKKLKKNNSQINLDNKSFGNMGNNYYYNLMAKDDLHNYSSLGYFNYIQKNKVALNKKKMSIKKKKGIHSKLEE